MDLLELLASDTVTVNMHDQKGGSNAYRVVNRNGVSEEALRAVVERYEAHVQELQALIKVIVGMNERLMALVESRVGSPGTQA